MKLRVALVDEGLSPREMALGFRVEPADGRACHQVDVNLGQFGVNSGQFQVNLGHFKAIIAPADGELRVVVTALAFRKARLCWFLDCFTVIILPPIRMAG